MINFKATFELTSYQCYEMFINDNEFAYGHYVIKSNDVWSICNEYEEFPNMPQTHFNTLEEACACLVKHALNNM